MTTPRAKLPDGMVLVTVRDRSYGYHATCKGKRASSTCGAQFAAYVCAAKVFRCRVCEVRIAERCSSANRDFVELFVCERA